ncbi:MAG: hypothetical protein QXU18_09175 [Thermoplasmatales archaeon]
MSALSETKGFCYREPVRHVEYMTDIDGEESNEFGKILSYASSAVKEASRAKLVYMCIFGDNIPHLHGHLAPHMDGDNYNDDSIKSNISLNED